MSKSPKNSDQIKDDEISIPSQDNDEMINCKMCGKEVKKSKIIMHLTRSKQDCKKRYGLAFDHLNS